ncbi:MAG: EamA family transporter [Thiomonas sp. 20-64-5]|nr:MAG: EamA family transporter [Thiomonas sp. 20-64-5]
MSTSTASHRASALMLLASLIWGTAFVAQTASIGTIGPFYYTGLRFLLGAAVVLAFMTLRRRPEPAAHPYSNPRSLLRDGSLLGVLVALSISMQQIGLESTTVANAGFISSLYVVLVPLLGLLWGRRIGAGVWLGALLAMLGLYLLSVRSGYSVRHGDWLELGGALFITGQILLLGRVAPRHDPLQLAAVQFVVCGLLCLGTGVVVETISLDALQRAAWTIVYGGALSVGVAYTLQVVAQRDAIAAHAAVIFSMEGVFAALAAWLVLHQALDARALFGCVLVFCGLVISQLPLRAIASGLRTRLHCAPSTTQPIDF